MNHSEKLKLKEMKLWVMEYKLARGCIDCGYKKNSAALHFDHITGDKSCNVSLAKGLEKAKAEVTKCVVRCANCHAEKTWPHLTLRAHIEEKTRLRELQTERQYNP